MSTLQDIFLVLQLPVLIQPQPTFIIKEPRSLGPCTGTSQFGKHAPLLIIYMYSVNARDFFK